MYMMQGKIQDSLGSWIPHSGFRIPMTGFQIFSRIPDLAIVSRIRDPTAVFRIPQAKFSRFRIPHAKISRIPESLTWADLVQMRRRDFTSAPSQLALSQLARLRCSNTLAYRFSSQRETARSLD